jgi:hypothetical protein
MIVTTKKGEEYKSWYRVFSHGSHYFDRFASLVFDGFCLPRICWKALPIDIKAHLIAHPAQPSETERKNGSPTLRRLLPDFNGTRRDLPLNRNAPANFEVVDCETAR